MSQADSSCQVSQEQIMKLEQETDRLQAELTVLPDVVWLLGEAGGAIERIALQ
jgi:hypothetical protein